MTKPISTRRLRIPIKYVEGIWECALGGKVPIKEGAAAELIVQRGSISDETFLGMMVRRGLHKVLDEGTSLLVCMTIKPERPPSEKLKAILKPYASFGKTIATEFFDGWNPGTLAFVEVKLAGPDEKQSRRLHTSRGGLWLMTQGLEAVGPCVYDDFSACGDYG